MAAKLIFCSLYASVMFSGVATANPVGDIFQSEGVTGTFVAASLSGDVILIHNDSRSTERFAPASTFKIPNTLIALDLGIVDWFWLNGSLKISAVEQIAFLRKLYNEELSFRPKHIDNLKTMMVTQRTERHTIYAKTGWAATKPQVAWYVGFVESGENTWLFAMNMQVDKPEQAALREELAIRSLRALGII